MLSPLQSTGLANSANTKSLAPAFGSPTTAGTLLVAYVCYGTPGATVTPPAGWTLIASDSNGHDWASLYYLPNNPGGLTTWTWNFATSDGIAIVIEEWPGIALAPLDQFTHNNGVGSAITTGATPSTAQPNELVLACLSYDSSNILTYSNLLNGFTQNPITADAIGSQSHHPHAIALNNQVAAIGAQSTGMTISASKSWAAVIATFYPAFPAVLTPAGSIASGIIPAGSSAAGTTPRGAMVSGISPAGSLGPAVSPTGTIATGTEPTGSIVRN